MTSVALSLPASVPVMGTDRPVSAEALEERELVLAAQAGDHAAAGEFLAARRRVAGDTVGRGGDVAALLDLAGIRFIDGVDFDFSVITDHWRFLASGVLVTLLLLRL